MIRIFKRLLANEMLKELLFIGDLQTQVLSPTYFWFPFIDFIIYIVYFEMKQNLAK